MADSSIPDATYRLQFNSSFRFSDATAIVNYLSKLGISDIYASPILTSRKGSNHGYDVTDPTQLDPDLGTARDFEEFQGEILKHGMRLILDIVPNHMAASSENRWWMDVLENGSESAFASYFDIDWHPPSRNLDEKVLLPVLGHTFGEALDCGDLKLAFEGGKFFVHYFNSIYPVMARSYRRLLKHRIDQLKSVLTEESPIYQEYAGIIAALSSLSESPRAKPEFQKRVQLSAIHERLQKVVSSNPEVAAFIDSNLADLNATPGDAASLCPLEHLLSEQHFRLAYWQDSNEAINYRRFFAISDLVGVRVEDPVVFDSTHEEIFHLSSNGAVRGLRVDHIDGLQDPERYLNRLQERWTALQPAESPSLYILVEKILSEGESLPNDWPVSGTTGYEYLNAANGLFVDRSGAIRLEQVYFDFISRAMNFADVIYEKKKLVMNTLLRVEMRSLGRQLADLAAQDRYARDILRPELMDGLIEVTACVPSYRTYIKTLDVPDASKALIDLAIQEARRRRPRLDSKCFSFITDVLTLANPPHILSDQREERLIFVKRWQQFTGPIVAKGVEDTALYIYYPLASLNEVGGNPEPSKVPSRERFFDLIKKRRETWPNSLNATSTHDTKRSEDVRAQINVLSEIPDEWAAKLAKWSCENAAHRESIEGRVVPDANEEYLIYQTLLGLWLHVPQELPSICERLKAYMIKAIREATVHTRWTEPNLKHEAAICTFINGIFEQQKNQGFMLDFASFHKQTSYAGMVNALGQALLKITCPGVPDFYQGSELWDFHLVDPDNRGPIDFDIRNQMLREIAECDGRAPSETAMKLIEKWPDGQVKMFVIWKTLNLRRTIPTLFTGGEFLPLEVIGNRSKHIVSFLRGQGKDRVIVVIPRWSMKIPFNAARATQDEFWAGTNLRLPHNLAISWRNVFTNQIVRSSVDEAGEYFPISNLIKDFPIGLLLGVSGNSQQ